MAPHWLRAWHYAAHRHRWCGPTCSSRAVLIVVTLNTERQVLLVYRPGLKTANISRNCSDIEFHGTDMDTDTDTDILADFRARMSTTSPFSLPRAGHARRSSPTCTTRALFLARMSVRDARLQNYTIGTSLMSVSVSVPWNSSLYTLTSTFQ